MKKLPLLVLLCMATSLPALAAPPAAPAAASQVPSADQKVRLEMIEKQKELLETMQLPPVQTPGDAPSTLDLPIDSSDSPGASKK